MLKAESNNKFRNQKKPVFRLVEEYFENAPGIIVSSGKQAEILLGFLLLAKCNIRRAAQPGQCPELTAIRVGTS
jgi:hypothetical protein